MPTSIAQIEQIYAAIDYAPPPVLDAGTLARYETLDPAAVMSAIETSPYTLNVVDPVIREYQAAFNRAPDPQGAAFWVHQLKSGSLSFDQLSTAFAQSAEFGNLYGGAHAATPANEALVTAFYTNVLHRSPDAGRDSPSGWERATMPRSFCRFSRNHWKPRPSWHTPLSNLTKTPPAKFRQALPPSALTVQSAS